MGKKAILTGIVLIFNVYPWVAFAAPTISNIGGTVAHGQPITINGTGFGAHPSYNAGSNKWQGKAYLAASFKDFEDSSITSQGFSGQQISDVSIPSGGPANSAKYSKVVNGSLPPSYGITQSGNNAQSIYSSFWYMMPTGTSGGKPWRWYFGGNSSSDNLYLGVTCGSPSFTMQGDFLANGGVGAIYGNSFSYDAWHKVEIYASAPNDAYQIWIDGAVYLDFKAKMGYGAWTLTHSTLSPDGHTLEFPDMIDGTSRGCAAAGSYNYDDIYIDYTQARVEICNGSTWANRGICNTQIPTSWNATSISVGVNKGTFSQGDSKYLYVVDTNGNASAGTPITFGGSVSTVSAPSGLTVVITAQ
jgi:hypothetical protein